MSNKDYTIGRPAQSVPMRPYRTAITEHKPNYVFTAEDHGQIVSAPEFLHFMEREIKRICSNYALTDKHLEEWARLSEHFIENTDITDFINRYGSAGADYLNIALYDRKSEELKNAPARFSQWTDVDFFNLYLNAHVLLLTFPQDLEAALCDYGTQSTLFDGIEYEAPASYPLASILSSPEDTQYPVVYTTMPANVRRLIILGARVFISYAAQEIAQLKSPHCAQAKKPTEYVRITSKLYNKLFSNAIDEEETEIDLTAKRPRTRKKLDVQEITVWARRFYNDKRIKGLGDLTRFDKEVYNSIVTLCMAGNTFISYQMILKTLTANLTAHTNTQYIELIDEENNVVYADVVKQDTLETAIRESVKKLMFTEVDILTTKPGRRDSEINFYPELLPRYYGALLNAEIAGGWINNNYIPDIIRLLRTPILLDYAAAKGQIARISQYMRMLTSDNKKSVTWDSVIIRSILEEHIEACKSPTKAMRNNTILIERIYKEVGINEQTPNAKQKKARCREKIVTILKGLKLSKYIKDYEIVKHGNIIYSVSIKS